MADGLFIDLNAVPVKYEGLDGTELAISESQERMAVVVAPENVEKFIEEAKAENLEAVVVAKVTEEPKLRMVWNGQTIVDISRAFLNTNGVKQSVDARVVVPSESNPITKESVSENDMVDKWFEVMSDLNSCSQKGLVNDLTVRWCCDCSHAIGGKYQLSPSEGMAAKSQF